MGLSKETSNLILFKYMYMYGSEREKSL